MESILSRPQCVKNTVSQNTKYTNTLSYYYTNFEAYKYCGVAAIHLMRRR